MTLLKKKTDGKVVANIDGVVKKIGTVGDAAAEGDNSDDGDDKAIRTLQTAARTTVVTALMMTFSQ